ncbi:MAG: hypothetical protein GT598_06405 [Bacteroidales bacterium]|nr:hypothetical protein [Bacteroidales bacterium]
MQVGFEKKLLELGLSYSMDNGDFYTISSQTDSGNRINVHLIASSPSIKQKHGSKNGNETEAIGLFKFKQLATETKPDFFIFALRIPFKIEPDFLIIPKEELKRRVLNRNLRYNLSKKYEMVFWIMLDGSIYETTGISPEAEWYYLSCSDNGRMADNTDLDYTAFLNNWGLLNL